MVNIRIPATSANMGPGFDCLGIALNLYNNYSVEETETGLIIEGCEKEYANKENLVYKAMTKTFDILSYIPKGIKIKMDCSIPISRGLGSSAACILAGVIGAGKISGADLNKNEILDIAAAMEGHPDNIAPALLGGMVVSILDGDKVYYNKINISDNLKFSALIPEFKLSTAEARSVLPKKIPFKHGTFNIGRVSMLISALVSGNQQLISLGCQDKLHQNYRSRLIENYDDIVKKSEELNSPGVFLSGAGPTIMTILDASDNSFKYEMDTFLMGLSKKWIIKELLVDREGAVY